MDRSGPAQSDSQATADRQRELQRQQDRVDEAKPKTEQGSKQGGDDKAVQAGARPEPSHMPAQHLAKPGRESDLELAPRFEAPDYQGSGKLSGRTAIITGGDSGIGRAVAVLFAREGADVAIVYLESHDDAKETVRHIEAEGRSGIAIAGDVRDSAFCRSAVKQVVDRFGKLDILVNNAAFQEHAEDILDLTDERFDETLRTNVYGYFYMARAAVPHLREGSAIINTGSETGLEGQGRLLDYSATKGAIHAFTKALAQNLYPKGIRVNAVAPGPVWTPLNPADSPAEKVAQFGQQTQMHRPAQPEEISPAYVFLAAPCCSSYISGIVLPITGHVGAI